MAFAQVGGKPIARFAIGEHGDARWALLVGGLAALVAAGLGLAVIRQGQKAVSPAVEHERLA